MLKGWHCHNCCAACNCTLVCQLDDRNQTHFALDTQLNKVRPSSFTWSCRYPGGGGRGDRSERRRGRGRGQAGNADFNRDSRGGYDRSGRPRDNYPLRTPPGLGAPPAYGQQQQYEEYDEYEEAGDYGEPNIYAPQTYDAPYGVYGSALGTAAASGGAYGQYGSYMG